MDLHWFDIDDFVHVYNAHSTCTVCIDVLFKIGELNVRHLLLRQLLIRQINANVKHYPKPNHTPEVNPYPTPNQKPNHYRNSNSLLSDISSQEQLSREQLSDPRRKLSSQT